MPISTSTGVTTLVLASRSATTRAILRNIGSSRKLPTDMRMNRAALPCSAEVIARRCLLGGIAPEDRSGRQTQSTRLGAHQCVGVGAALVVFLAAAARTGSLRPTFALARAGVVWSNAASRTP